MADQSQHIWFNGKILPWEKAKIHVMSHVLHYVSGVFEGIKCYLTDKGPAIFNLPEHIDRLFLSAILSGLFVGKPRCHSRDDAVGRSFINGGPYAFAYQSILGSNDPQFG